MASKVLQPLNNAQQHDQRRELLRQQVCEVCPHVGSGDSQQEQKQPGHVPISILLNTAKDRQPGTSWVFPDGSQVFASSLANSAASSDEVMAELEQFAAQTGGEHYTRSGDTVKASSSRPTNPMDGVETNETDEEDDDGLDDFMTQFEEQTGGENFQRQS